MNNYLKILLSLSSNDKRVLVAIFLLLILIFVFVGLIGSGIARIMKWQGYGIDHLMWDMVTTKVLKDKKHFRKVAMKKNNQLLFKQMWLPFLIACLGLLIFLVWRSVDGKWSDSLVDRQTGLGSLWFTFKWEPLMSFLEKDFIYYPVVDQMPIPTINALLSYIIMPIFIVTGVWFFFVIQSFISRVIRINVLSHSIYTKKLDHYTNARGFIEVQKDNSKTEEKKRITT